MVRWIQLAAIAVATAALACAVPSAAGAQTPPTRFPLAFKNYNGSVTIIPRKPTRVVDIGQAEGSLDNEIALGVPLVGAVGYGDGDNTNTDAKGFPMWVNGGELDGVQRVGNNRGPPDFEAIAAL